MALLLALTNGCVVARPQTLSHCGRLDLATLGGSKVLPPCWLVARWHPPLSLSPGNGQRRKGILEGVTDESPSLQTLWQYALRFTVEELFLDSKLGAFELEDSQLRSEDALRSLYLVAAIAILYATTQGMAVQIAGLRQQVDPHWRRGISASQDRIAAA